MVYLLDVDALFGARFKVGDVVLALTPLLRTLYSHRTILKVNLYNKLKKCRKK